MEKKEKEMKWLVLLRILESEKEHSEALGSVREATSHNREHHHFKLLMYLCKYRVSSNINDSFFSSA